MRSLIRWGSTCNHELHRFLPMVASAASLQQNLPYWLRYKLRAASGAAIVHGSTRRAIGEAQGAWGLYKQLLCECQRRQSQSRAGLDYRFRLGSPRLSRVESHARRGANRRYEISPTGYRTLAAENFDNVVDPIGLHGRIKRQRDGAARELPR